MRVKFIYYEYQNEMSMAGFLFFRMAVGAAYVGYVFSRQGVLSVSATCEPALTPSILFLLSILLCISMVRSGRRGSA